MSSFGRPVPTAAPVGPGASFVAAVGGLLLIALILISGRAIVPAAPAPAMAR